MFQMHPIRLVLAHARFEKKAKVIAASLGLDQMKLLHKWCSHIFQMGGEMSRTEENAKENCDQGIFGNFQPKKQEDVCHQINIELVPIKRDPQTSSRDFKKEEELRFFWSSRSMTSFRNDKLTMRQKVAEAEGWCSFGHGHGQHGRRRVEGVESLVNDR